jgi:hypothetical protein
MSLSDGTTVMKMPIKLLGESAYKCPLNQSILIPESNVYSFEKSAIIGLDDCLDELFVAAENGITTPALLYRAMNNLEPNKIQSGTDIAMILQNLFDPIESRIDAAFSQIEHWFLQVVKKSTLTDERKANVKQYLTERSENLVYRSDFEFGPLDAERPVVGYNRSSPAAMYRLLDVSPMLSYAIKQVFGNACYNEDMCNMLGDWIHEESSLPEYSSQATLFVLNNTCKYLCDVLLRSIGGDEYSIDGLKVEIFDVIGERALPYDYKLCEIFLEFICSDRLIDTHPDHDPDNICSEWCLFISTVVTDRQLKIENEQFGDIPLTEILITLGNSETATTGIAGKLLNFLHHRTITNPSKLVPVEDGADFGFEFWAVWHDRDNNPWDIHNIGQLESLLDNIVGEGLQDEIGISMVSAQRLTKAEMVQSVVTVISPYIFFSLLDLITTEFD